MWRLPLKPMPNWDESHKSFRSWDDLGEEGGQDRVIGKAGHPPRRHGAEGNQQTTAKGGSPCIGKSKALPRIRADGRGLGAWAFFALS